MTDYEAHRARVADHVQSALSELDGVGMVTEFVLIAVRIDEHGEKSMSVWTPPDQRLWTTQGLMSFAAHSQLAHTTARYIQRGDD